MMSFLHWICETYLAKKRKKGKRKSVNQYWRDFKMLYRRINGAFVDANDSNEVVKVCSPPPTVLFYRMLILRAKYINGTLKVRFELDSTSKSKPVAGPDDLLLLLVQHWARDEHVFPTEDDRHDVATILLFQSYTGGRPAEFVHSSKGKASEDPLGEAEETIEHRRPREEGGTHDAKGADADDGLEYDDDSDAGGGGPEYDDDILFDSDDDETADEDGLSDEGTDESAGRDSGYSSDGTDVAMMQDTDDCCPVEVDGAGRPVRQNRDAGELTESGEAVRRCKALCYEDICLWIVQNPKKGERDLLAMEVHLRHHKGVDNKPKPCVAPPQCVQADPG
jgi:hypothetical protein